MGNKKGRTKLIMVTPDLTPFQICLIRLNTIAYRLSWANFILEKTLLEIPKYEIKNAPQSLDKKKNDAILLILFEYIILNIDQLIDIHPTIARLIKEESFIDLIKSLNKIWKPIQEGASKIRKWRNLHVAHSGESVSEYMNPSLLDPDYFETQKEIFHFSRLATFYIEGIFENFDFDYKSAMQVQKKVVAELKPAQMHEQWEEMKKITNKILIDSKKDVIKAGFLPAYPIDFNNPLEGDNELDKAIRG